MEFDNQNIELLDVSFYQAIRRDQFGKLLPPEQQKAIDFVKMKNSGISAVVIRAGQHTYRDSEFVTSWENARLAGIPRAAYWFCDKDSSPQSQAQLFWEIVKNDPPEGFLAGDIEYGSWTKLDSWYVFFNELQQISGLPNEKIFFYTNYYFFEENTIARRNTTSQKKWFSDRYPLWLAGYAKTPSGIKIPGTWKRATLWQDGTPSVGLDVGVWSKEVDHNYLNGGADEFNKYFGGEPMNNENPIPENNDPVVVVTGNKYKCNATAGLNVRSNASTLQSPIGVLKYLEVVDEISKNAIGDWIQIKTSSNLVGWCYAKYLTKVETQPETPPSNDPSSEGETGKGFWFALHDWLIPPNYKLRDIRTLTGGTPEIFRAGSIENPNNIYEIKLIEKLQKFWFEICSLYVFGKTSDKLTKAEYKWLAKNWTALGSNRRAYTNLHGLDKFRNYITKERLNKDYPVLYSLLAGGASCAGIEAKNSKGVSMIKLDVFDINNLPDPRTLDIKNDPRIMFATNISKTKVGNGYKVSRFPMFSEPEKGIYRDVPVPLFGYPTKPLYYYKNSMKWVLGTKKPTCYNP